MVLNACGRPMPPPGYRFVDLFRVIPFFQQLLVPPGTPFQARLQNTSDTVFICRGFATTSDVAIRLRWPDGHFLNQFPSTVNGQNSFPFGLAGNMLAMPQERAIDPGARMSIEMSGPFNGDVKLSLWGVLRYMMKASGGAPGTGQAAGADCIVGYPSSAGGCVVGYPVVSGAAGADAGKIAMMPNPVDVYADAPRIRCGPNQNLMAPEWLLGNQCTAETPAGYEDESFTFFSDPIVVPVNGQNYGNVVIVPGSDDVVVRWLSQRVSFQGGLSVAIPTFAIRLPNGYSYTGGDMVPWGLLPGGCPVFPSMRLRAGDRIIIDAADTQAVGGVGQSTTVFQFDGVKRRKVAA